MTYCSVVEAYSTQESILFTGGASLDAIRLELDKGTIVRECCQSEIHLPVVSIYISCRRTERISQKDG